MFKFLFLVFDFGLDFDFTLLYFYLRFVFDGTLIIFHLFYYSCSFFVTKERTKKVPLLKKLNGSLSNQFATCSACGTRLLRKLKHPRLLLQVPFYLKFSPVFWKSCFAQIRTLGKLLWTTAMLPKVLISKNYKFHFL